VEATRSRAFQVIDVHISMQYDFNIICSIKVIDGHAQNIPKCAHIFFHVQIMVSNAISLLYGITMHISCKPSLKFINSHTQINQYGGKKHI
jgi:hypothetical protein